MNQPYKWVGSKRRYLDTIKALMPDSYNVYHEPFFGGGALYFDLEPRMAMVSDAGRDNINFIKALAGATEGLLNLVGEFVWHYNRLGEADKTKAFEAARASYNALNRSGWGIIHLQQATRFYALLWGGYNGLWRMNKKGELNTPFGGDRQLPFQVDELEAAARLLSRTIIRHCDFEVAMRDAAAGDFVFLDPPYLEQYTGYTGGAFGVTEHYRLYRAVDSAVERGVAVMVTTNDHPHLRNLYRRYEIVEMPRMDTVGGKGAKRGKTGDIVIRGGYTDGEH